MVTVRGGRPAVKVCLGRCFLGGDGAEPGEVVDVQARAADQGAVDVLLAVSRWDLEPDRCAIAVPVFGPGGYVAAAIELRIDDLGRELSTVKPSLMVAGRSLTRELTSRTTVRSPERDTRQLARAAATNVRRLLPAGSAPGRVSQRQRLRRRDGHNGRGAPPGSPLLRRHRHHPLAVDALAVRRRADDRDPPPAEHVEPRRPRSVHQEGLGVVSGLACDGGSARTGAPTTPSPRSTSDVEAQPRR